MVGFFPWYYSHGVTQLPQIQPMTEMSPQIRNKLCFIRQLPTIRYRLFRCIIKLYRNLHRHRPFLLLTLSLSLRPLTHRL